MTILYVHQYFRTPNEPGGTRSYWIARRLVEAGHSVIVLTSKNSDSHKKKNEIVDGIQVVYLPAHYEQSMGVFKRIVAFISFAVRSLIESSKVASKVDLVYATSTPLTVGIPALFLYFVFRKKYIFEVRDLWPEVPVQLKYIENNVSIKCLKWFEKIIYTKASSIIALSPGMFEGVLNVVGDKTKISMIPNMAKNSEFYPRIKDADMMEKLGIDSKRLNFLYFGSLGYANGLHKVVEFFGRVGSDFHLYIAGTGSEEDYLIDKVNTEQIKNVSFIGSFNTNDISNILNCCDVSIVSFLNIPILSTNSPNKFFDSLSAGKPILVNSDGWTRDLVEKNRCGIYYKYDSFKDFKVALEALNDKDSVLKEMGERARTLSNKEFDKELLTLKVLNVVESISLEGKLK